jgi:HAD superfamily hydrolase (TIGR01484 family)
MKSSKVFFSDLDRTLIFSRKFVKKENSIVVVERKGEKPISYMTKEAMSLLQQLRREVLFIPVSTRTWDEITRIDFIHQDIPDIIVCDNGAYIYLHGKKDATWEQHVASKRDTHATPVASLETEVRDMFLDRGLKDVVNRDNLYLVLKFNEMTWEIRQMLEILYFSLRKKGYRVEVNSKKAYVLPNYITKENAVQYLMEKHAWKFTVSAGDSYMDVGMLRATQYAIAPKHKSFEEDFMIITNQEGIKAGEEILHLVQHICRYK